VKRLVTVLVVLAAAAALWWLPHGGFRAGGEAPTIAGLRPRGLLQSVPESCAWEAVTGARVYRLAVFDGAGQVLGTSYTNHTPGLLGPSVREKLRSGGVYFWQVVALDGEGRVLGSSKATRFQLPDLD
jgi:hypothetical protein